MAQLLVVRPFATFEFMDNESLEIQIAKMDAQLAPRRAASEERRRIFEGEQTQIARLEALQAEADELDREEAEARAGRHPGDNRPHDHHDDE